MLECGPSAGKKHILQLQHSPLTAGMTTLLGQSIARLPLGHKPQAEAALLVIFGVYTATFSVTFLTAWRGHPARNWRQRTCQNCDCYRR